MFKRFARRLPSPAMTVALAALFVALGGTTYAATGGNFILGNANSATSQTALTSSNAGKALNITQQSTGTGATALGLSVPAGKAPFTVNSGTKVANLNADKLDGLDSTGFLRNLVPLSLSGADATAAIRGTNTGTGNGLQGVTSASGASGVYGQNDGGGIGVAGRSNQANGIGVLGEALGVGGRAGQFNGDVGLSGNLNCSGCVGPSDISGKVGNADALDGIDSNGFVQGAGQAGGQAVAIPAGQNLWLGNPLLGFLRLIYACPANLASNGTFAFNNDSGSVANVFVESGGANPSYYQMNPGDQVQFPASTTGDSWHIQAQGALGIITIEAASVHRSGSNDCHVQAQALLTK